MADCRAFALALLNGIEKMLADFHRALRARGHDLNTYHGIKYAHAQTAYPLRKLRASFSGAESLDAEAAYIFTKYLENQLSTLLSIAREVDSEYQATSKDG